jgi:hypothetical protein
MVLPHAKRDGPALQVVMDRRFLLRALKLGFTEILLANAQHPLLCKDANRIYVWMPLAEAVAVPARPVSHLDEVEAKNRMKISHPEPPKCTTNMPPNETGGNGEKRNGSSDQDNLLDPISEAEDLRGQLQTALTRMIGDNQPSPLATIRIPRRR